MLVFFYIFKSTSDFLILRYTFEIHTYPDRPYRHNMRGAPPVAVPSLPSASTPTPTPTLRCLASSVAIKSIETSIALISISDAVAAPEPWWAALLYCPRIVVPHPRIVVPHPRIVVFIPARRGRFCFDFPGRECGLFTSPLRPREDRRVPGSSYLTVAHRTRELAGRRRTQKIVEG